MWEHFPKGFICGIPCKSPRIQHEPLSQAKATKTRKGENSNPNLGIEKKE